MLSEVLLGRKCQFPLGLLSSARLLPEELVRHGSNQGRLRVRK